MDLGDSWMRRGHFDVLHKAALASASLLFGIVAAAAQTTSFQPEAGLAKSTPNTTITWRDQNRFLEIFGGRHRQDYAETDTAGLTSSGTLDTETGDQGQVGFALRWQTAKGWLLHLQAQRQNGVTDYNGHLQMGDGSITPFRASTGNIATRFSASFGYAINSDLWHALPQDWQITPSIQFAQYHWDRNLAQYSETYDFKSYAMGFLAQWQARFGTVLEAQAVVGQTKSADVGVPALDFAAQQSGGNLRELQVGISQDLGALTGNDAVLGWRVAAHYSVSEYGHGTSPLVNGLKAPPNQSTPSNWTLGLQKEF